MNYIVCLIVFVVTYLLYLLFVINRKKVLKKFSEGKEFTILKSRYGIKITDDNIKPIAHLVALSNAFIIAILLFLISHIKSFLLGLLILFISSLVLIFGIYSILGNILKKKQGGKKHV